MPRSRSRSASPSVKEAKRVSQSASPSSRFSPILPPLASGPATPPEPKKSLPVNQLPLSEEERDKRLRDLRAEQELLERQGRDEKKTVEQLLSPTQAADIRFVRKDAASWSTVQWTDGLRLVIPAVQLPQPAKCANGKNVAYLCSICNYSGPYPNDVKAHILDLHVDLVIYETRQFRAANRIGAAPNNHDEWLDVAECKRAFDRKQVSHRVANLIDCFVSSFT